MDIERVEVRGNVTYVLELNENEAFLVSCALSLTSGITTRQHEIVMEAARELGSWFSEQGFGPEVAPFMAAEMGLKITQVAAGEI